MNLSFKKQLFIFTVLLCNLASFAQGDTEQFKGQIALGVNSPSSNGFVESFEAKPINFPTVHLGLQYMFKKQWGAKVDFGFNRFSNSDNSPDFKVNYTRVNAQLVYNAAYNLTFLPKDVTVIAHAGPGFSWVKPLSEYKENNTSFFNVMAGVEVHYYLNRQLSIFIDSSYIFGFADNFKPVTKGYGSFNGDLLAITAGVSFSLSGCKYCN